MAQVHTVTLLADHKGITRPKVAGDEYVVDALVDITSHLSTGAVITAASLGLNTITSATICGHEGSSATYPNIEISATGGYESSTSIAIHITSLDGTNATVASDADPACAIRVRVWGQI
jgi:hypothetical protein